LLCRRPKIAVGLCSTLLLGRSRPVRVLKGMTHANRQFDGDVDADRVHVDFVIQATRSRAISSISPRRRACVGLTFAT